jgi:hypothetical protein
VQAQWVPVGDSLDGAIFLGSVRVEGLSRQGIASSLTGATYGCSRSGGGSQSRITEGSFADHLRRKVRVEDGTHRWDCPSD